VKVKSRIRGAHGCTGLVSAFCVNELPRCVVCLRDNASSQSARAHRRHAGAVRSPDARYTGS